MTAPGWIPPTEFFAQLPRVHSGVGAYFTDTAGRALIVKTSYHPSCAFVGGWVDENEPPHDACRREIKEEIGLDREPGRLLVLDWTGPREERLHPILYMIFDCGAIAGDESLVLQAAEIETVFFINPADAHTYMADPNPARLQAAAHARATDSIVYLPGVDPAVR